MRRMWIAWLVWLVFCVAKSIGQVQDVYQVAKEYERNVTLTSDLLDLFNLKRIIDLWPDLAQESKLGENCTDDMSAYLSGLEEQRIWALKSGFCVQTMIFFLIKIRSRSLLTEDVTMQSLKIRRR